MKRRDSCDLQNLIHLAQAEVGHPNAFGDAVIHKLFHRLPALAQACQIICSEPYHTHLLLRHSTCHYVTSLAIILHHKVVNKKIPAYRWDSFFWLSIDTLRNLGAWLWASPSGFQRHLVICDLISKEIICDPRHKRIRPTAAERVCEL